MEGLAAYAATHKRGGRVCVTCATVPLVVRRDIARAREKDASISWPIASTYLAEKHGITIKPNALRNHFVAGHSDKESS